MTACYSQRLGEEALSHCQQIEQDQCWRQMYAATSTQALLLKAVGIMPERCKCRAVATTCQANDGARQAPSSYKLADCHKLANGQLQNDHNQLLAKSILLLARLMVKNTETSSKPLQGFGVC